MSLHDYGHEQLSNDDNAITFNAGYQTVHAVFNHVLQHVLSCFPALASKATCRRAQLSDADRFLLTLMRLCLGLRVCFQIGLTTASKTFSYWLDAMYLSLKVCIKWPTQDICFENMPQIFKDLTRCIINCSEVFTERPYSFQPRAQT